MSTPSSTTAIEKNVSGWGLEVSRWISIFCPGLTVSGTPTFADGSIAIADLDIDGGTEIGADIVDADLFIIDDGAGGTNRKVLASRIKTGFNYSISDQTHIQATYGFSFVDSGIDNFTDDFTSHSYNAKFVYNF